MKVFFTADIHIKLGQRNVPKEWARNRYRILWDEFERVKEEHQPDIEVHAGDIFDKTPTLEELRIYFDYVSRCRIPLIITDGNHEATKKGHTFLTHLKDIISGINPKAKLIDHNRLADDEIPFDILAYRELHKLNPKDWPGDKRNVLVTHVRGEIPPHVKPEVDLKKFNKWKKVYAGDLHSHSNTQRNIVYPGSPVSVSFHRNMVQTGVLIFDTENPEDYEWVKLEVPQLIRKTVKSEDEMIKTDFHHTVYELEGDIISLSKVKDKSLLDKKITTENHPPKLSFKNSSSIEEELSLYLKEIVSLDDKTINEALKIYNDYSNQISME